MKEDGFDIPHNKHLGKKDNYWSAPQKNSSNILIARVKTTNEIVVIIRNIESDENVYRTNEGKSYRKNELDFKHINL